MSCHFPGAPKVEILVLDDVETADPGMVGLPEIPPFAGSDVMPIEEQEESPSSAAGQAERELDTERGLEADTVDRRDPTAS